MLSHGYDKILVSFAGLRSKWERNWKTYLNPGGLRQSVSTTSLRPIALGYPTHKLLNVTVAANGICVGDVHLEANTGEKQRVVGGTPMESQ